MREFPSSPNNQWLDRARLPIWSCADVQETRGSHIITQGISSSHSSRNTLIPWRGHYITLSSTTLPVDWNIHHPRVDSISCNFVWTVPCSLREPRHWQTQERETQDNERGGAGDTVYSCTLENRSQPAAHPLRMKPIVSCVPSLSLLGCSTRIIKKQTLTVICDSYLLIQQSCKDSFSSGFLILFSRLFLTHTLHLYCNYTWHAFAKCDKLL